MAVRGTLAARLSRRRGSRRRDNEARQNAGDAAAPGAARLGGLVRHQPITSRLMRLVDASTTAPAAPPRPTRWTSPIQARTHLMNDESWSE